MRKVVTVIGARPQFIKAAVVSHKFKASADFQEILLHTGQHYDASMSEIFFSELEIPRPGYNLEIGSASHGKQTGEMLAKIETVLLKEKPDWVLVYGDTNSTLAGALAAAKLHIPVAHVEAGLRSYNKKMPEEINRIVADQLSDILFVPTRLAIDNLEKEGFNLDKVHWSGDVMYDAAVYFGEKAAKHSQVLDKFSLKPKQYVLATIHRAENTDVETRLRAIFEALMAVAKEIPVVLPLHPRTKKVLQLSGMLDEVQRHIALIEPQGFLDMITLEKNAALIATDSGGVQKEAFFYQVPCVTLRDETEWGELVQLGWNRVVPPLNEDVIKVAILQALTGEGDKQAKPYGEGNAAGIIVSKLRLK